jgi:hypothetical protein
VRSLASATGRWLREPVFSRVVGLRALTETASVFFSMTLDARFVPSICTAVRPSGRGSTAMARRCGMTYVPVVCRL